MKDTIVKKYAPILVFSLFLFVIFRKIFLNGLYPYPGDLLVSFFFPYNSGGWEGFTSWVAHKEFVAADVVRQLYPWKQLAMDQLRQGALPLWNPYAFSGTPLAANLQTAAFYPLNVIFFLLPFFPAWIIYLLLQVVIMGVGMYLFLRSLQLSKMAALFSACASGFIGYLVIWFELGVVGHTACWLPFILWGITKFATTKNKRFLYLASLFLSCSLLAGHAQTAVYVLVLSSVYFFFTVPLKRSRDIVSFASFLLLGVGIASLQLFPSIELLLHSARNAPESSEIFRRGMLPLSHLVTFFAPDFFGNQTTGNYWGKNYGEFMAYAGIVVLTLAVIGMSTFRRVKEVRFFTGVLFVAILFALPGPLSLSLDFFHIPVLGSAIPARTLFLVGFSLIVLAAYGIDVAFSSKKQKVVPALLILLGVYGVLWVTVFIVPRVSSDGEMIAHMNVAMRNLILPTGIFIGTVMVILFFRRVPKYAAVGVIILICFAAVEYQYFFYKFNPFAPANYLYPTHPLVTELQKVSGNDRVYGYDTARLETNLSTAWRVQSPEGYDPLFIESYGQLIAGTKTGEFPVSIPRSDANFVESIPNQDSIRKERMLNLLGVRYITDKDDYVASSWQPNTDKYPENRFVLKWQYEKWKLYENKNSLPRASVFYSWEAVSDNKKELERLMESDFPYTTRLTLGGDFIGDKHSSKIPTRADIVDYSPNTVIVKANAEADGMLFLSDVYYPGWHAYVDGIRTAIFPVNYTFRGVPLQKGNHTVAFRYEPLSFYGGAFVSGISLIMVSVLFFWSKKKRGKHEKNT